MQQLQGNAVVPKTSDDGFLDFNEGTTNFRNDKILGNWGEQKFYSYMLKHGYNIKKQYGNMDWDFNLLLDDCKLKLEVKTNYKNDEHICIEEWHSLNTRKGWIYNTFDVLICLSTSQMIWIDFPKLQQQWNYIKSRHTMIKNSSNSRNSYVSAFYRIPLTEIEHSTLHF